MNAIAPLPIEIDPRPCGWCGLTIDRHQMVDDGEGPEFFCVDVPVDELTLDELERRAELRRQEEVAAIVECWEATDVPADIARPAKKAEPYRSAQSSRDAFFYLVALDDVDRLKAWLDDRPIDAPILLKLLEGRR
jgi:hypothetical protein